ncbi:DUF1203 domain-containing protein [Dokdonella sp.]|uniref:DUF1203 domain-containing protein n=1 Tax=Dokdonella sp. TaxID=2291710 RepID=UPI0026056622|nr:DUF1203 domain-containing protein [Dokdonella sp.]
MPGFRLSGLPHAPFEAMFDWSHDELSAVGARRCIATEDFGFPCRVSLEEARAGEELLLLPFQHQPEMSPYRASGPIFVRRGATQCRLPPGVIPPYVARRLISWRAYDRLHDMIDADVRDGAALAEELERLFALADVAYVHLHNARRGCFSCLASRVD